MQTGTMLRWNRYAGDVWKEAQAVAAAGCRGASAQAASTDARCQAVDSPVQRRNKMKNSAKTNDRTTTTMTPPPPPPAAKGLRPEQWGQQEADFWYIDARVGQLNSDFRPVVRISNARSLLDKSSSKHLFIAEISQYVGRIYEYEIWCNSNDVTVQCC